MRAAVLHGPGELRVEEVLEAVGRPEAWRAAVQAARPGGTAVLGGDCSAGSDVALRAAPLHHAELDVRGGFHHAPAEVDRALELLATGAVDWRAPAGEARKPVVDPWR